MTRVDLIAVAGVFFTIGIATGAWMATPHEPAPPKPRPALCELHTERLDKQTAKALNFWLGPMSWVPCSWIKEKRDV